MEENIYDTNISALKERYREYDNFGLIDEISGAVPDMNRLPEEAVFSEWGRQFDNILPSTVFYIIGFGNGSYIRELLERINITNSLYIYEPDVTRLAAVMRQCDISDIIMNEQVVITVTKGELIDCITGGINYLNYQKIRYILLPEYDQYGDLYQEIKYNLEYQMRIEEAFKLTRIDHARNSVVNELHNIPKAIKGKSVTTLIDAFNGIDLTGVPAIIVAAGPSLDRNIKELKRAEGHALIIVVDTAIKAVLRNDITPNIMVCVDPNKEEVFFEHQGVHSVPVLFAKDVPYNLLERKWDCCFFQGSDELDIMNYFASKFTGKCYKGLASGGCVANTAFSLAVELGFKKIILVGQDLAYTNGMGHTKDAYDDDIKNHNDTEIIKDSCYVESIDGGTIRTESRMNEYRIWFENMIEKYQDVHVMDGTEGGALIHGSEVISLAQAIKRECGREIDFTGIINDVPDIFTDNQQMEILDYLRNLKLRLDELKVAINEGIGAYNGLPDAIAAGNNELKKLLLDKITAINGLEESEPLMSLINKYTIEEQYIMQDNFKDSDKLQDVIDNAVYLLRSYTAGIDKLKKDTEILTLQL